MRKFVNNIVGIFVFGLIAFPSIAQVSTVDSLKQEYLNWYNMSPSSDSIMGTDVERAYATILKDKKTKKTVVVAVIDAGVDTQHEDLVGQIWVNEDEVAGNGIDDDKNGYIDDVHGWNFLGNADGNNLDNCNMELTRIIRQYKSRFDGKTVKDVSKEEKELFLTYERAVKEHDEKFNQFGPYVAMYKGMEEQMNNAEDVVKKYLKKDTYTAEDLDGISSEDESVQSSVKVLKGFAAQGLTRDQLEGALHYLGSYVDYYLNVDFDARGEIIKDKPFDMSDAFYGNTDVKGSDAMHGCMVSGIIAATRNNGIGVNGIATDVKIMALRTVPNGDENDKDVALSIRYAADNGANIINMSFGKGFSPMKSDVDEAVKYAQSKGVLMVKASGNDGINIDEINQYPCPYEGKKYFDDSWLTVGASDKVFDKTLAAGFSNYGKRNVHVFAPGVDIISTTPDNTYEMANGTSFACPVVTGVAALVWSYYPELSAEELKEILMKSSLPLKNDLVQKPGEKDTFVKFGTLSQTGGVVNTVNALQLAEEIVSKKKVRAKF